MSRSSSKERQEIQSRSAPFYQAFFIEIRNSDDSWRSLNAISSSFDSISEGKQFCRSIGFIIGELSDIKN